MLLLVLSCGIVISAYRSLSREFSGFVVKKTFAEGAVSTQYWLFLLPDSELATKFGEKAVINALTPELATEFDSELNRVGVSAVVFNEANSLNRIEKQPFSPIITVNGQTHIDLGINWLLFGIFGICLAVWMYLQTLKTNSDNDAEEIELPGY